MALRRVPFVHSVVSPEISVAATSHSGVIERLWTLTIGRLAKGDASAERCQRLPNGPPNQLRAATARHGRRGAAVAAPNNCIGRSDLQLP